MRLMIPSIALLLVAEYHFVKATESASCSAHAPCSGLGTYEEKKTFFGVLENFLWCSVLETETYLSSPFSFLY